MEQFLPPQGLINVFPLPYICCIEKRISRSDQHSVTIDAMASDYIPVKIWFTKRILPVSFLFQKASMYRKFYVLDKRTVWFKELKDLILKTLASLEDLAGCWTRCTPPSPDEQKFSCPRDVSPKTKS